MLSIIGMIAAIVVMVILAYRGISIYIFAPIAALIVILASQMPILGTFTGAFMDGFSSYAKSYFLLFALGSGFAAVMRVSGAANVVAYKLAALIDKREKGDKQFLALNVIASILFILTLGGVNLFVVIFVIRDIAKELFKKLNVPWHLYFTGAWAWSSITMTMIPGTPAIQNLVPMPILGTQATAAPVIGIVCSVFTLVLSLIYVKYALNKSRKKSEGFLPTGAIIDKMDTSVQVEIPKDINMIMALIPSIIILVVMNVLKQSPVVALLSGIVAGVVLFRKHLPNMMNVIGDGFGECLPVIGSTCVIVGFGSVVAASPGYAIVIGALTNLAGPALLQLFIATNVAAGVTGSASGGLAIALNGLGKHFLDMGINPQHIHRIAAISCGGLDSLPHNGFVNAVFKLFGSNHKDSYIHFLVQSTIIPLLAGLLAVILASAGLV